jgi:hypothetical protein
MQVSPPSRHLISLRSKYPPQHPAFCLCSSLNVRDQVSHPYRITGNFIVLYILVSTFLVSRREHKMLWTEW